MKYLVPALLIVMSGFFGFSAKAEDGKQRYFIADQISELNKISPAFPHRSDDDGGKSKAQGALWYKISVSLGIPDLPSPAVTNYRAARCFYELPLKVLQDIRKSPDGTETYQKIWVENQSRVFSACDKRIETGAVLTPLEPVAADLPARAKSDYLYQLASWNFYYRDTEAAQKLYEQVAADKTAPMRPYANYMLLRILRDTKGTEAAYDKVVSLLTDPTLKPAFPLYENYRFILGWENSGPDPKAHLEWLLSIVKTSPEMADDLETSFANYSDATDQLNAYFPPYPSTGTAGYDWWLGNKPLESARMEAVRAVAPHSEIADWMQSLWAYNRFDKSWLWALHNSDKDYWAENQNIAHHAWTHWKAGDGMEWLEIAARRIHPKDPLSVDILSAISPYLTANMQAQYGQHQPWLLDLWAQSIRLHLGRDEFKDALTLVQSHPEFSRYAGVIRNAGLERDSELAVSANATLDQSVRWLYYVGHYDEARAMLKEAVILFPRDFRYLRILLATNWDDVVAMSDIEPYTYGRYRYYDGTAISPANKLWYAMADALSTKEMEALSKNEKVEMSDRGLFAISALTRAFLLNENHDILVGYAETAITFTPAFRAPLLKALQTTDRNDFVGFMVRNPRLRPTPTLYIERSSNTSNYDLYSVPEQIDHLNGLDNNWWCAVSGKAMDDALFEQAYIGPKSPEDEMYDRESRTYKTVTDPEIKPYLDKQREFLTHHPYHTKVDEEETKRLEAIGSGARYLTEAVIAHADSWRMMFFQTEAEREQNAANLAYALNTTHFGCGRYGRQAYSRKAFKLLHDRYPDSIWAEATPYWY